MPLRLLEPSYSAINDVVPVGVLSDKVGGGGGCAVKCPYNGGLPLLWVTDACARAVPSGTKQKCKAKVKEKSSSVTCHRRLSLQQTRWQRIHRCSLHLKPYDLAVWSMESSRICCRTSLQSFKCQTAEVPLPFMICGCSGTPAPGTHTLRWADYSTDTMRYEGWWDAGGRPRWGRRHTDAAPPRRNSPPAMPPSAAVDPRRRASVPWQHPSLVRRRPSRKSLVKSSTAVSGATLPVTATAQCPRADGGFVGAGLGQWVSGGGGARSCAALGRGQCRRTAAPQRHGDRLWGGKGGADRHLWVRSHGGRWTGHFRMTRICTKVGQRRCRSAALRSVALRGSGPQADPPSDPATCT